MKLVDKHGNAIGSDATTHDALKAMIAKNVVLMTNLKQQAQLLDAVCAALQDQNHQMLDLCEQFGVRPTREEIVETVQALQKEALAVIRSAAKDAEQSGLAVAEPEAAPER